jgi:hypothetical protein
MVINQVEAIIFDLSEFEETNQPIKILEKSIINVKLKKKIR